MNEPTRRNVRHCFRLLGLLSALLPRSLAQEWREEWETELLCQRETLRARGVSGRGITLALARTALGALPDAWRLAQPDWSPDMFFQDLRYAFRLLARKPGFTFAAALTLAVGIGAGTAIFSVVNAVLLQPLPYPEPNRLAMLWEKNPEKGWYKETAAPANFLDWKERATSFESMAAYGWADFDGTLTTGGEPEVVRLRTVSGDFFGVLGVPPLLGRTFRGEETWKGEQPVAVLSHGLWTRRFGADPEIVGKTISVDGQTGLVVGVMPKGFQFPGEGTDLWTPFGWDPANREQTWFRRAHFVHVLGRLKPGVPLGRAEEELALIAADLEKRHPETNTLMGNGATPLHEWIVGDTRPALLALFGAVGLLLLIACGNVAHLQLARSTLRAREIAVRNALGAGRWRLIRQLLTESLALAVLGGIGGVALAYWGVRLLVYLSPPELPRIQEVGLDSTALAFAVAATLATTLVFGLFPAIQGTRGKTAEELKGSRTSLGSVRGGRARSFLVVGEIALALVVVAGAGLLLKSLHQLNQVDLGFPKDGLYTFSVVLPEAGYEKPEARIAYFEELFSRLEASPQVESASGVSVLPLTGSGWTSDYSIAGRAEDDYGVEARHRRVHPGYFKTLGVPLLQGRTFGPTDRGDAPRVILINKALADREFPGQDPIGQRLCFDRKPDEESVWRTIVGVVGNEKQAAVAEEARPEIFHPWLQEPQGNLDVVVRTRVEPVRLASEVRGVLAGIDPRIPFYKGRTMEEVASQSVARERFLAVLLGMFAAVGLILATIGIYGVTAYAVTQRLPEIGVRMAFGAQSGDILAMILGRGAILVGIGLASGLALSLFTTRYVAGLLYRVSASDPATFTAVSALLAGVALLACLVPARRASRIDPMSSLRAE